MGFLHNHVIIFVIVALAGMSGLSIFLAKYPRGLNLERANLAEIKFREVILDNVNLQLANLSKADLKNNSLREANLRQANLSGAKLNGADLSGANLSGANLSDADLREADLRRADLRGADLSRADLRFMAFDTLCESNTINGAKLVPQKKAQIEEKCPNILKPERLPSEPEMVEIPGGEFQMGSSRGNEAERPLHSVKVHRFLLSKYEVTFEQYDTFAKATRRKKPDDDRGWGRADRPVINVSWEDARAYAQWLQARTGQAYRLPTEAEWEYAARAGSDTRYSFGDDEGKLGEYAWYRENSDDKTHTVGQKTPNAWGLYDMHGNVWEWVEDDWHDDYKGAPTDGTAWKGKPRGASRVVRGGGWPYDAQACRSAIRFLHSPGIRVSNLGFRLARSVTLGS